MAPTSVTVITATAGKKFVIELESNPTTGYEWQPAFPSDRVRLIRLERPLEPASSGMSEVKLGAGGVDRFVFKALAPGRALISMDLKRAWESTNIEHRVFQVTVRREQDRGRRDGCRE